MKTDKYSKTQVSSPPRPKLRTLIIVAGVATIGGVLAASALPRPSDPHSETRVPFLLGISLLISLAVSLAAVLISRPRQTVLSESHSSC